LRLEEARQNNTVHLWRPGWYTERRRWMLPKYGIRVIAVFLSSIWLAFFILLKWTPFTPSCWMDNVSVFRTAAFLTTLGAGFIAALIFGVLARGLNRHAADGFGIKTEFKLYGVGATILSGGALACYAIMDADQSAAVIVFIVAHGVAVLFLVMNWMPVVLSYYNQYRVSLAVRDAQQIAKVEQLLVIPEGYQSYLAFCSAEFAPECPLFWKRVDDWRKLRLNQHQHNNGHHSSHGTAVPPTPISRSAEKRNEQQQNLNNSGMLNKDKDGGNGSNGNTSLAANTIVSTFIASSPNSGVNKNGHHGGTWSRTISVAGTATAAATLTTTTSTAGTGASLVSPTMGSRQANFTAPVISNNNNNSNGSHSPIGSPDGSIRKLVTATTSTATLPSVVPTSWNNDRIQRLSHRLNEAISISQSFIVHDSTHELNVSDELRQKVLSTISNIENRFRTLVPNISLNSNNTNGSTNVSSIIGGSGGATSIGGGNAQSLPSPSTWPSQTGTSPPIGSPVAGGVHHHHHTLTSIDADLAHVFDEPLDVAIQLMSVNSFSRYRRSHAFKAFLSHLQSWTTGGMVVRNAGGHSPVISVGGKSHQVGTISGGQGGHNNNGGHHHDVIASHASHIQIEDAISSIRPVGTFVGTPLHTVTTPIPAIIHVTVAATTTTGVSPHATTNGPNHGTFARAPHSSTPSVVHHSTTNATINGNSNNNTNNNDVTTMVSSLVTTQLGVTSPTVVTGGSPKTLSHDHSHSRSANENGSGSGLMIPPTHSPLLTATVVTAPPSTVTTMGNGSSIPSSNGASYIRILRPGGASTTNTTVSPSVAPIVAPSFTPVLSPLTGRDDSVALPGAPSSE
jgi:hypothetical protein